MNFTQLLISWYAENKRELPWRDIRDPYAIWISEIILQQTRVAQGYDYFIRFMRRFPDVGTLATAPADEVMKYWEGLGYYSRARHLHEAARSLTTGRFPTTYEGVRALKGVGDYTAAAICSFAYDMPYAVVDGNVYRVLSRYFGIDTPIDTTQGKKLFAAMADEQLDRRQPATYNQAIMDFGALQCLPQSPDCLSCPLVESCAAFRSGCVSALPRKQHKTKVQDRHLIYIYTQAGDYTFIRKREGNDIWKNLFEFPLIEPEQPLTEAELRRTPAFRALFGDVPIVLTLRHKGLKHVLSHRILHVDCYDAILPSTVHELTGYRRITTDELSSYAFPRLIRLF
ncbi:MAG: A/G-specific adenine glycosylase [Prevotellaceae bacterium]|jgi:A/G-specific adenine glycosylase|nr:A/G-specific adenine glycosylase [Prevotellaceae bacterium]